MKNTLSDAEPQWTFKRNKEPLQTNHDESSDCKFTIHVRAHTRAGYAINAYERICGRDHSNKNDINLQIRLKESLPPKDEYGAVPLNTEIEEQEENKINPVEEIPENRELSSDEKGDNNSSQKELVDNAMNLIEKHEGYIEHAYFDSVGNLTTGYGHLIPDKAAYMQIDWVKNGHHLTDTQKAVNYEKIMGLKDEYGSNHTARSQTRMKEFGSITESEARIMAEEHIENISIPSVRETLAKDGVNFDSLPPSVKTALIDIEYNTGNFKSFGEMREGIQERDFAKVAEESHRKSPVLEERNQDVYGLIIQGQREMEHKSKYGTWE